MDIRLILLDGHYPVGLDIVRLDVSGNSKRKSDIVWVKSDIVHQEVSGNVIFSQNPPLSSQT
jgi:hypothetical protein